MEIKVTRLPDALVVGVDGRLDSTTAPALEQQLLTLIEAPERRLVLDFSQLVYITSAGLRTVLVAAKRLKNAQGELILCSLNAAVHKVFDIAGFLGILPVRTTLEDALALLRAR